MRAGAGPSLESERNTKKKIKTEKIEKIFFDEKNGKFKLRVNVQCDNMHEPITHDHI